MCTLAPAGSKQGYTILAWSVGPSEAGGQLGTKGDQAGGFMTRTEGCLSEWPRMSHNLWVLYGLGNLRASSGFRPG